MTQPAQETMWGEFNRRVNARSLRCDGYVCSGVHVGVYTSHMMAEKGGESGWDFRVATSRPVQEVFRPDTLRPRNLSLALLARLGHNQRGPGACLPLPSLTSRTTSKYGVLFFRSKKTQMSATALLGR